MKRSTKPLRGSGLSTKSRLRTKTKIKHRSKKKEAEYVERRKVVSRLLGERPWCEACPIYARKDEKISYVRRKSQDIHELKRRSQGGSILDEENLMAVCRRCHERIGANPAESFELGLSVHGWENSKKS